MSYALLRCILASPVRVVRLKAGEVKKLLLPWLALRREVNRESWWTA